MQYHCWQDWHIHVLGGKILLMNIEYTFYADFHFSLPFLRLFFGIRIGIKVSTIAWEYWSIDCSFRWVYLFRELNRNDLVHAKGNCYVSHGNHFISHRRKCYVLHGYRSHIKQHNEAFELKTFPFLWFGAPLTIRKEAINSRLVNYTNYSLTRFEESATRL